MNSKLKGIFTYENLQSEQENLEVDTCGLWPVTCGSARNRISDQYLWSHTGQHVLNYIYLKGPIQVDKCMLPVGAV
jgi:hypothetical protein